MYSIRAKRKGLKIAFDAMGDMIRVSKLLSERGVCSRREADEFIRQGLVEIDGTVVSELGAKAQRHQTIALRAEAASVQNSRITILLHKPVGYVSHSDDNHIYSTAAELVTADNLFSEASFRNDTLKRVLGGRAQSWAHKSLAPAGRLDIDSSGLLVLTEDGRISKIIIGEDSNVEKEYLVRVRGELTERGLALLRHGLRLDGRPLLPADVFWQNSDQLSFVLREGRNRQIRRMCELVGLAVVGLKRVRIGKIALGNLPYGKWRIVGKNDKF